MQTSSLGFSDHIYPMRGTRTLHFILLNLTTLIIFGEAYMLWSYIMLFLHPPPSLSLSWDNHLHHILSHASFSWISGAPHHLGFSITFLMCGVPSSTAAFL
jgi:hypothetical protein